MREVRDECDKGSLLCKQLNLSKLSMRENPSSYRANEAMARPVALAEWKAVETADNASRNWVQAVVTASKLAPGRGGGSSAVRDGVCLRRRSSISQSKRSSLASTTPHCSVSVRPPTPEVENDARVADEMPTCAQCASPAGLSSASRRVRPTLAITHARDAAPTARGRRR